MPTGSPIDPLNGDTCLLACLLEQEVERLSDIAFIFASFIPFDMRKVQPPAWFALENPADVF